MDLLGILLDVINGLLSLIMDEMVKGFIEAFNYLNNEGISVLDFTLVKNGVKYAQTLSFSLLSLKLIFEGYQTYLLRQAGDPDGDPMKLVINGIQALTIIAAVPTLVTELYKFGGLVASDIVKLGHGRDIGAIMGTYQGLGDYLTSSGKSLIGVIVMLLLFIVGVIMLFLICVQIALRSAELGLMTIVGPIMALNISTNNRSLWSQWFRTILGLCLTHALQVFMLMVTMYLLSSFQDLEFGNVLLFIGWLWITVKTPNFIKQFTHSTGAGSVAGGALKQYVTMRSFRKMGVK